MVKGSRMSAEERRRSILTAAVPLFAQRGFNGTTTREIAKAADVSEALLYRHFPNKEVIYREIKNFCCRSKEEHTNLIAQLEPSTSTLIHAIYFLINVIVYGDDDDNENILTHNDIHRLLINSYLEDGSFARMFLEEHISIWESMLRASVKAAEDSGDMVEGWLDVSCRWWFAHHIAVALGILNMPEERVIPYGVGKDKVVEQAILFSLRGMGLTDKAIKTHYNPAALALFRKQLLEKKPASADS